MIVQLDGRSVEYVEIPGDPDGSTLLFLHEGLGSVGLWQEFPARVAAATGMRTLVYSRLGHGSSDPPPAARTPAFMHQEARVVLPRLLEAWGVERPVLVGHSDGASIALIYAAGHPVDALVCIAPHVFVEERTLTAIREAKVRYEREDARERMVPHHRDPDAAFYGWNDVWLNPEFACWNIEGLLPQIEAPLLLIQGSDDPYGSLAHVDSIAEHVRGPRERVVLRCRHAPHIQAADETVAAITNFLSAHRSSARARAR